MKKTNLKVLLMTCIILITSLLVGCNTEKVEFETPEISVTPTVLNESRELHETTFTITTNRPWKIDVTSLPDWLSVSPSSGEGDATITVGMLSNDAAEREGNIKIATSTVYTGVKVVQAGAYKVTKVFDLTFGKPARTVDIADYKDWNASGMSSATTTFSGTGDIRNTSVSEGKYQNASGEGNVFLGNPATTLQINNINVSTGQSLNYVLTFGTYTYSAAWSNEFVQLEISTDQGATWTNTDYQRATNAANWALCTTEFPLTANITSLSIRFTAGSGISSSAGNQPRIDDVVLTAQGSVTVVEIPVLTTTAATNIKFNGATVGGTYDFKDPATELGVEYKKTSEADDTFQQVKGVGTVDFSVTLTGLEEKTQYSFKAYAIVGGQTYYGLVQTFKTPAENAPTLMFDLPLGTVVGGVTTIAIDKYTDWSATGQSASTASFDGANADIRGTSISKDYDGASGGYNVYSNVEGGNFVINNLNVNTGTAHNYQLTFGSSFITTFENANLTLQYSQDGGAWTEILYTRESTASGWRFTISSDFAVDATTKTISIRFTCNTSSIQLRLDDIKLYCTTPNVVITEIPIIKTIPVLPADISDATATVGGSIDFTGTITERGIAYRKSIETIFKNAAATGTSSGTFTVALSGLTSGTVYTYKAYAIVNGYTYYGVDELFVTTGGHPSSIATLLALPNGQVTTLDKIVGTVVSNRTTGNMDPKSIVIQDNASENSGITIRTTVAHSFNFGQELEVAVTGGTLSEFQGVRQLTPTANTDIVPTGNTSTPTATTITVDQLKSGKYTSMYVAIANTQVVNDDLSNKMNGGLLANYASTDMEVDASPVATYVMSVKASSPAATFGTENVPQLNGTLKGIASINSNVHQIMPQFTTDFEGWNAPRFGPAAVLTYLEPKFTGSLKAGTAITGSKISLPYKNAKDETVSATVAVSGAGANGISVGALNNAVLATGAGTLEFTVSGTPTAAGDITFTINGLAGLTSTTVNTTVASAGGMALPATLSLAELTLPTSIELMYEFESGATLERINGGGASSSKLSYTKSSSSIYTGGWQLPEAAWIIKVPLAPGLSTGDQMQVKYGQFGTKTSPKTWSAFYSTDGTTWVAITDALIGASVSAATYDLTTSSQIVTLAFTLGAAETVAVNGNLHIKIAPASTDSIGNETAAEGGNSRLGTSIVFTKMN